MTTMRRRGMLLAAAAAGLSGVAVFLNSYGVRAFGDATAYTTGKNVVAGILLAAAAAARARRPGRRPAPAVRSLTRWQVLGLTAVAVIGGSVPFVLFFEGLAAIESGPVQAQLINKTLVVWVVLFAVVALRERIGPLQAVGVATLLAGQVWLAGGMAGLARLRFGTGEALILAATILWAVEVVLAKRLLASLSSSTVAVARMGAGSALLLGWLAVRGRLSLLVQADARQWTWLVVTGVLLAAYVGVWLAALALAPATGVTAVLVAAVPVTAVLQAVVDHTALAPQLGGLTLVTAGAALAYAAALAGPRRSAVAR